MLGIGECLSRAPQETRQSRIKNELEDPLIQVQWEKKKSRTSKNRETITNKVTERHTIAAPEEEKGEQSAEQIFTVITAGSCPKLMSHSKPQMQEAR